MGVECSVEDDTGIHGLVVDFGLSNSGRNGHGYASLSRLSFVLTPACHGAGESRDVVKRVLARVRDAWASNGPKGISILP